jgi:uncharacterized protein (DUF1800 family)
MALLDIYDGPWGIDEAAHLARRAGFGARPDELEALVTAGMDAAVDRFVDYDPVDEALEAQVNDRPTSTEENRIRLTEDDGSLQGWWLYRMVHGNQPLQEQFTLFLHDTLVSEYAKVSAGVTSSANDGNDGSQANQPCQVARGLPPDSNRKRLITVRLMKEQNDLLRQNGHSHYRQLLRRITRDPGMLIYLDNRQNAKGKPQENYAREIMELFAMGVGNYTEEDVRAVARAFTGETINAQCSSNWPYSYFFDVAKHDQNLKTVFGQSFAFSGPGEDTNCVNDLMLDHISYATEISPAHATLPAAALYLSWKLLTWFVGESLAKDDPAVAELGEFLYTNTVAGDVYHLREVLRKLFKSQFFYRPQYRYTMYKHPADFVVMALRSLQLQETSYTSQARSFLDRMGMRLFSPPNVAGWSHGQAWVNSGYLLNRYNYANRLSSSAIATDAWVDNLLPAGQRNHAAMVEFFGARLIQTALRRQEYVILYDFLSQIENSSANATAKYRRKIRGLIHLMMTLPQYQLK